jgi:hypothetical protein
VSGLYADLADEASRIVLDLSDPGTSTQALQAAMAPKAVESFGRDLSWFGITPWRELVAQFFDPPGAEKSLAHLRDVKITVASPDAHHVPRVGLWLAAWLAGQLGWTGHTARSDGPGRVHAVFQGPAGPVTLHIQSVEAPHLDLPEIRALWIDAGPSGTFRLKRVEGSDDVTASTDAPGLDALARTLRAREWDRARRLAAAFESARDDPPYRAASPWLLWLLDAAEA